MAWGAPPPAVASPPHRLRELLPTSAHAASPLQVTDAAQGARRGTPAAPRPCRIPPSALDPPHPDCTRCAHLIPLSRSTARVRPCLRSLSDLHGVGRRQIHTVVAGTPADSMSSWLPAR